MPRIVKAPQELCALALNVVNASLHLISLFFTQTCLKFGGVPIELLPFLDLVCDFAPIDLKIQNLVS